MKPCTNSTTHLLTGLALTGHDTKFTADLGPRVSSSYWFQLQTTTRRRQCAISCTELSRMQLPIYRTPSHQVWIKHRRPCETMNRMCFDVCSCFIYVAMLAALVLVFIRCSLSSAQMPVPVHFRSGIWFSYTCDTPNWMSGIYRLSLLPLETLHWLCACKLKQTFALCKVFLEGTLFSAYPTTNSGSVQPWRANI